MTLKIDQNLFIFADFHYVCVAWW